PRHTGRPVFVIGAPPGLALLPATTRSAPQRCLATALRLPLAARGVVKVLRFHRALQPAIGFVGQGRVTQPLAPAIPGPALDSHLSGNPSRRTRQAQQEGGAYPVSQRPLAPVQAGFSEVVEGALTTMAPGAFASGAIVVRAPAADVVALAARTRQRP